jgi:hypothetical protein
MIRLTSGCAIAIALEFGCWAVPIHAQVLVLVSEAEVAADRAAAPRPSGTRGPQSQVVSVPYLSPDPNAPHIDVLAPEVLSRPLTSPFPIHVRFVAAEGRAIDPATFKIFYGRLALDITSRILSATPVTQQGLDVPSARVPKGSHRLLLEIRDNTNNIGRSELEFDVGG